MRVLFFICSTTILIGFVCLIRIVCRKHLSPRVIYILWLPVLVRLLLPADISLAAPTGMARLLQTPYIWMEQAVKHIAAQDGTEMADGLYAQGQSEAPRSAGAGESNITNSIFGAGAEIAQRTLPDATEGGYEKQAGTSKTSNVQDMQSEKENGKSEQMLTKYGTQADGASDAVCSILVGIWLLGIIIFGISTIVSNRKLHRYVKGIRGQYVRVRDIMPDCETDLPVVVCDEVPTPCLAGVFRPCILVSRDVMEQSDLLYYSLLHETTHYRHRDNIWTFLRVLVCVVYWWNPLVWLAARLAKQDCEFACDFGVIAGLGAEKKKEYGMSLLKLLEKNRQPAGGICIATAMTANGADLKRRIKGIANETKTKRYILIPAVLVMAVVFLAGCSGKADGNWIKYSGTKTEENDAVQHKYYNYAYSLQDDLKNAVLYYEVYEYGKLASRPQVNVVEMEGADGEIGFGWDLETLVSEDDEQATKLNLHCKENDMEIVYQVDLEAYHAVGCIGSILGENEEPLQIQGDVPIPIISLYLLLQEQELEPVAEQDLINLSAAEIEEKLPKDQVVILLYFAVSDKTQQELLDVTYETFEKDESAKGQQQNMQEEQTLLKDTAQEAQQDAVQAMAEAVKQNHEEEAEEAINRLDQMYAEGSAVTLSEEVLHNYILEDVDAAEEMNVMVSNDASAAQDVILSSSVGAAEEVSIFFKEDNTESSDASIWENYELTMQWAEAFIGRNGSQIVNLSTEAVQDDFKKNDLLEGQEDYISFGYSSPWPAMLAETVEEGYRIVNVTNDGAEILYYAHTSEPHVAVWKETLTINDEKKVAGETLVFLDDITDGESFRAAYPMECLLNTPMDYQTNGLGQSLNDNALLSSTNYYKPLFAPETAAEMLLNLHADEKDANRPRILLLDERETDGTGYAYVEIGFPKEGETFLVLMVQPYKSDKAQDDAYGIWIPAAYVAL